MTRAESNPYHPKYTLRVNNLTAGVCLPETATYNALGWFVRLLASDIQEVTMVARVPGLPGARLVNFERIGQFQMRSTHPIEWVATEDGACTTIEVEPADVASPYRGKMYLAWHAGSTVTVSNITMNITQ